MNIYRTKGWSRKLYWYRRDPSFKVSLPRGYRGCLNTVIIFLAVGTQFSSDSIVFGRIWFVFEWRLLRPHNVFFRRRRLRFGFMTVVLMTFNICSRAELTRRTNLSYMFPYLRVMSSFLTLGSTLTLFNRCSDKRCDLLISTLIFWWRLSCYEHPISVNVKGTYVGVGFLYRWQRSSFSYWWLRFIIQG